MIIFSRVMFAGIVVLSSALAICAQDGDSQVNGGGLIFSQSVPLPDAGQFAFDGEAGAGAPIFTSERRAVTLGVRFHHISNGDRTGSNRGLTQFVFYAGFSVFK